MDPGVRKVVAAVLINQEGRLALVRRPGQENLVLPGRVMQSDENEQEALHLGLRELGFTFDQARRLGCFEGPGLFGWPRVALHCFQPNHFTVGDRLKLVTEWVLPTDVVNYPTTVVEELCFDYLREKQIWPMIRPTSELLHSAA